MRDRPRFYEFVSFHSTYDRSYDNVRDKIISFKILSCQIHRETNNRTRQKRREYSFAIFDRYRYRPSFQSEPRPAYYYWAGSITGQVQNRVGFNRSISKRSGSAILPSKNKENGSIKTHPLHPLFVSALKNKRDDRDEWVGGNGKVLHGFGFSIARFLGWKLVSPSRAAAGKRANEEERGAPLITDHSGNYVLSNHYIWPARFCPANLQNGPYPFVETLFPSGLTNDPFEYREGGETL